MAAARAVRCAVLLVGLLGAATAAGAVTIGPGESLAIDFAIPGTPLVGATAPDVFTVSIGSGSSASGLDSLSVRLSDGGVVLGEAATGFQTLWAFTAPGSLWTLNAVAADLSSLLDDGTFQGQVSFTPSFVAGAPSPQLDIVFPLLNLGRGTQASGLLPAEPGPEIRQAPAIPEPTGLLLFAAGLAAVRGALRAG